MLYYIYIVFYISIVRGYQVAQNSALDNLGLVLTSPRPRAPSTLTGYLFVANQFLTWLGDRIPPDDMDFRRYFLKRRDEGISENTLRAEFAILKKLYLANHWPFQFTSDDRPEAPSETNTPAFTKKEVELLIKNRELYSNGERFYLAIATIYAPRRIELARIRKRDIKDNTIYIDTAKKGEKRTHLIPDEIMPYIEAYRPREHTVSTLSATFGRICKKGLGEKKKGYGWHSFRRCLITLLIINLAQNNLPITLGAEYMRWSRRTIGAAFLGSITAATYVRAEARSDDPYYIDREVLSIHPFLPLWADKGQ
jgi:hypothetical protein